ncbi:unnamed protein product [Prunus armeniaca]|uniref:Uncharacterized protein n=1 Tax=Prunus armeniaca TaxID=36596 RepID=A0A6J5VR45_PRUAR|nr:unnamed protein product [Prunus armeniaca]
MGAKITAMRKLSASRIRPNLNEGAAEREGGGARCAGLYMENERPGRRKAVEKYCVPQQTRCPLGK